MRSYSPFILFAAASVAAMATSAQAQRVTNDIDAVEMQQRGREAMAQRGERMRGQSQAAPAQSAPVFVPRAPRDSSSQRPVDGNRERAANDPRFNRRPGGFEVRNDNGEFVRRPDPGRRPPQGNVDVRPDDRRFGNRGDGQGLGNAAPPPPNVVSGGERGRFGTRRIEPSDGQRFGRDEEYRGDRDERRRSDRDDLRRRGEFARDGNWYRDNKGRWQRRDGQGYAQRGYGDNRGGRDYRWNHDWRRDSRYDWRSYRYANRNFYRLSPYYDPFGSRYGYQRFSIGIRIGSGYYSDRYWISDPFAYRLPLADGPYRWVRYYDDVLLIDLRNGYVVDVIYDFFW